MSFSGGFCLFLGLPALVAAKPPKTSTGKQKSCLYKQKYQFQLLLGSTNIVKASVSVDFVQLRKVGRGYFPFLLLLFTHECNIVARDSLKPPSVEFPIFFVAKLGNVDR